MDEIWKDVVGYEGWYSVSNLGRVRRDRSGKSTRIGYIIKPVVNSCGYFQAFLCRNSIQKPCMIAHLVAEAFIGPRTKDFEVNHKDFNKKNNCADNLEYLTPKENVRHAYTHGVTPIIRGERHGMSKLTKEKVIEIRRLSDTKKFTKYELAKMFSVSRSAIAHIVFYRNWKNI